MLKLRLGVPREYQNLGVILELTTENFVVIG